MRTTAVLVILLCLALRPAAQDLGKPQAQTQCKFSGGSTIRVRHLSQRNAYELATEEDLLTVRGTTVPAGHYLVLPAKDPRNDSWTLKMRNESAKLESGQLPPLPMSVSGLKLQGLESSGLPVGGFTVSFDQTGGSCMMHWHWDEKNVVLSLEFTEKNADLPLAQ